MLTKKAKIERFDALQIEHDLFQRYFWDTRQSLAPEAKATYRTKDGDVIKAFAYGTHRGDGGYVVIDLKPGTPFLRYYGEFSAAVREMGFGSEYEIAMHSVLDQLRHALYVAA